jgi:hypothetical protein
VQFSNQCCGGNTIYFATTSVDITKQHVYEVNWQTDNTTFYIDGVQQFQTPTPSGSFQTTVALSYFLTSDATYFGYASAGPSSANLPATASIDWYRIYQKKPTGTAPVGCNSLTQMDQCVALAAAATPQPLKVIFSHRGNEIPSSPSSACNARQANGLWFDSGGSSGNDDGCGDGGNVTYAAFKANTAALMQRYAGNSTVIGYDFHAEPLINGAFTGTGGSGSGNFSVNSNAQIIDPNGNVFLARGINVDPQNIPTLADIQGFFPRLTYVRFANFFPGCSGYCNEVTPQSISTWVKSLTDKGIVVQFSDYTGNGACRSGSGKGSDLVNAAEWLNGVAQFYASNPYVWYESQNECFDFNGGQPSRDQINANYYAVHQGPLWAASTSYLSHQFASANGNNYVVTSGNCTSGGSRPSGTGTGISDGGCSWDYMGISGGSPKAIFLVMSAGGGLSQADGAWFFLNDQTFFTPMTNVAIDTHPYAGGGGGAGYGSPRTQGGYDATLQGYINAWHSNWHTNTESTIPLVLGEFGNGCCNNVVDADGPLAVQAGVDDTTTSGSGAVGFAYWLWFCSCSPASPGGANQITQSGSPNPTISSPYGQQLEGLFSTAAGTGPTPFTGGGGTGANPPVNWGGGGDTDILAACNDVGAAVFAVNPGVIQFCEGPLNNGANNLLSGAAKP